MTENPISRVEGDECPVPEKWRSSLKRLADAYTVQGELSEDGDVLTPKLDADVLEISRANIADYPDAMGELADSSWATSIHVWQGSHWEVLIDLTTENGQVSDLVLHCRVAQVDGAYVVEPGLVYVP